MEYFSSTEITVSNSTDFDLDENLVYPFIVTMSSLFLLSLVSSICCFFNNQVLRVQNTDSRLIRIGKRRIMTVQFLILMLAFFTCGINFLLILIPNKKGTIYCNVVYVGVQISLIGMASEFVGLAIIMWINSLYVFSRAENISCFCSLNVYFYKFFLGKKKIKFTSNKCLPVSNDEKYRQIDYFLTVLTCLFVLGCTILPFVLKNVGPAPPKSCYCWIDDPTLRVFSYVIDWILIGISFFFWILTIFNLLFLSCINTKESIPINRQENEPILNTQENSENGDRQENGEAPNNLIKTSIIFSPFIFIFIFFIIFPSISRICEIFHINFPYWFLDLLLFLQFISFACHGVFNVISFYVFHFLFENVWKIGEDLSIKKLD